MARFHSSARGLIVAAALFSVVPALPAAASDIILLAPKPVTRAETLFQNGIAALEKKDLAGAEAAFKESAKLDSAAAAPLMGLAQVALLRNQPEVAAANMKKALALAPNSSAINTSWGTYLYTQRDLPAAEAALRKAISLNSNEMAAHLHLGDMYLVAFKKPDDAIKEYKLAISAAPDHAGAHYALGLALATKGDVAQAEPELLRASQLAPANPLPQHVLGRLYSSQKQYDKAMTAFAAALKIYPQFPAAHFERAQIFAATGNDTNALVEYQEVQKNDPKRAVGYTNIGMLHQRNKRWSDAQSAYLSAIAIEPKNALAYNNLAWMTTERKADLPQGVTWAKKAIALGPQVAEFQVTLGWVYRTQGDVANAEQTLRAASAIKPAVASASYYLGRLYMERGRTKEAAVEIKKALAQDPNFPGAAEARTTLKTLGES